MTEKEWMDEGLDLKLELLLYFKKIWISIVWLLAGALAAGGLYFLTHVVFAPARQYEAVSKLYLTFAADDDGDAYQYYNGYTWNDLMGTEPILDGIMEALPGYDRGEVRQAVAADILSDIRLLTITVSTNDPARTNAVIRACEESLVHFGQEMVEFEKIEVIEHGQAALVAVSDETLRALLAGGVIGFLLSLLGLALLRVLDDVIYVPADVEKGLGLSVLGVRYRGEDGGEDLKDGPKDEGILEIPYGAVSRRLLERQIAERRQRGERIVGAVITGADRKLYDRYFYPLSFGKRNKKEDGRNGPEGPGSRMRG